MLKSYAKNCACTNYYHLPKLEKHFLRAVFHFLTYVSAVVPVVEGSYLGEFPQLVVYVAEVEGHSLPASPNHTWVSQRQQKSCNCHSKAELRNLKERYFTSCKYQKESCNDHNKTKLHNVKERYH